MKKYVYLIIVLLTINSCVKEEFSQDRRSKSLEINADVATPIGYTSLSLEKLLTQINQPEELVIDETGFMTLVYHKDVYSATAGDVISFPELNEEFSIENQTGTDIDLSVVPLPQTYTQTINMNFTFNNNNGEKLDSVWIEFAYIELETNNINTLNGNITATFPTLTKNGVPYSATFSLESASSVNSIENYTIALTNTPDGSNVFPVEFEIEITGGNGTITDGSSIVDAEIIISQIEYEAVFGNVGQHNVDTDMRTIMLDFYSEVIEGAFHFEEPEINVYFNNSFGVPVGIGLYNFEASTKYQGDVEISGSAVPTTDNPFVVKYPSMTQIGQSIADTLTLTPDNANLFEILEQAPKSITYGAMATTNPTGSSTGNFIHKNSSYDVDVELILPLYGHADFMVMQDTMKFNVKDFYTQDIEEIKKLTFKLFTTNMFPVNIETQIYFTDQNYVVLDSMFTDTKIISSANDSDGDGISEATQNEPLSVEFDRDKVENIENAKFILVRGRISTKNADAKENVKFYSFYTLDANLGVIVTVETNTANY